ncbi:hypothetical protein [Corynebacterium glutamicum]|uniref:hypothetical protein n=1 Tax=Corynebacterium glutamicum TaxID=1718 RepID=UPI00058A587D|nr:hypothetical protein [Corynebacterium glutamicum]AJE67898.1 hypothetical protein SB89_10240 [Corynebacterium glutamicum]OKX96190.1 hypothetical protein AUP72_00465 [Corynebacterium glutamicum]TWS37446.1 hypothetical protein AKJ21_07470 [Corynebacterium glutamicum]
MSHNEEAEARMYLVVDQGIVKATIRIGENRAILSDFTTSTDLIVDRSCSLGYFIADVEGQEDWWLYECCFLDGLANPIVRVATPQLALSEDGSSFFFKILHNRRAHTVRGILGAQVEYCLLDSGLAPNLGEVVKLADPIAKNSYTGTSGTRGTIVPIPFDFTGGSLGDVARRRIRPHNKKSQDIFHSFLGALDDSPDIIRRFSLQDKEGCDGIGVDDLSLSANQGDRCEAWAYVLNTYGMYGSQLGEGSGFKFYSRRQSIYESSLDSPGLDLEEYSDLISTALRKIRNQGMPVFASSVSAGSIPLTLAAINDPFLCNGLIISKGLRFPVSGKFTGKIDQINIADYLSVKSKSVLSSVDVDAWYSVPTLLLSASSDSRIVPSERLESRSADSAILSFEYDGGHLAAGAEVEMAVEMLRVYFINEVVG